MKALIANLVHVCWLSGFLWPGEATAQIEWVFTPPAAGATNDGNWAFAPFDGEAGRFQQVYLASDFSSLGGGAGGLVYGVAFRVDAWLGRTFDEVIPRIQLNLSTTLRQPDALSVLFDDNVGSDDTVVLGPKPVHIVNIGGGGNTGFGTFFDFRDQPFFYDPSQGNLLIDFRIDQGLGTRPGGVAVLDAFDVTGDSVSTVFGYGPSVPSSGTATSIGLATLFFVTPIPEPPPLALGICGVVFLVLVVWYRDRQSSASGNRAP